MGTRERESGQHNTDHVTHRMLFCVKKNMVADTICSLCLKCGYSNFTDVMALGTWP